MTILCLALASTSAFAATRSYCPREDLDKIERLSRQGTFQTALSSAQKLLATYPEDDKLHAKVGALLRTMGMTDKAIREYSTAYRLNPKAIEPLVALSELYLQNLDYNLSLTYARLALHSQPNSRKAQLTMIAALLGSDRFQDAEKELYRIYRSGQRTTEVKLLEYQLNKKKRNYADAISTLKSALPELSDKARWLVELSDLLEGTGEFQEARNYLEQAVKLQPESPDIRMRLATNLEFFERNYLQAAKQYKLVLALDPSSVTAMAGIERCKSKQNDVAGRVRVALRKLIENLLRALSKDQQAI